MIKRSIIMKEKDYVATVLEDIKKGDIVRIYNKENNYLYELEAMENIPFGNKIELSDINKGEKIVKYNEFIGECTQDIKKGYLVHVHNVKSLSVDIPPVFKKEIMRQMNI